MIKLTPEEIAQLVEKIHLEIASSKEIDDLVYSMASYGLLSVGHLQNYREEKNKFGVISRAISSATLYLLNYAIEMTTPNRFNVENGA